MAFSSREMKWCYSINIENIFCIKNINKEKYIEFLKLSGISNSLLFSNSDFDKVEDHIIKNGLLIE